MNKKDINALMQYLQFERVDSNRHHLPDNNINTLNALIKERDDMEKDLRAINNLLNSAYCDSIDAPYVIIYDAEDTNKAHRIAYKYKDK